MAFIRGLAKVIVFLAIILFVPGVPPYGSFDVIDLAPTLPLTGPLDPKDYVLNKVEKLFNGEIIGPEGLAVSPKEPGVLYITPLMGPIMKVSANGSRIQPVARLAEKCRNYWDAKKCGRPFGIRFDKQGNLIVADAYLGIFKVDVQTGKAVNLVPAGEEIDRKTAKMFNSLAITKGGKIYYTVSSTNYYLNEAVGEALGAPSGRLMVFDPVTKKSKVLKEGVHGANGLLLSKDEDFIVFSEALQYRLHRYWLKGGRAGSSEVFLEGLPGSPDNMNLSPKGNILVPFVVTNLPDEFSPTAFIFRLPWLRKILLRLIHMIKFPLDLAATYLEMPILQEMAYNILDFEVLRSVLQPYGILVEIDWNGKIINSWHTRLSAGNIPAISEATVLDGYLYLGTPVNNYLRRIPLDAL